MSQNEDTNIPSHLTDVSERLRSARPTASDDVVFRATARAQQVRPEPKRSFLWANAPRLSGRTRGIAIASSLAVVGMTGAAAVVNSNVSGGGLPVVNGDAAQSQYCPAGLVALQAQLAAAQQLLNLQLALLPIFQNPILIADLQAQILGLNANILLCIQFP